jgi:adenine phosphoribosyltransferase
MTQPWENKKIEAVLSIESRGFIMAGAIAYKLGAAFIPFRKPDKLPGETFKISYTLEYGSTEMHVHKDALNGLKNVLIIDDLLATGGTALAAVDLVNMFEDKKIIGAGFIINLPDLKGDQKLIDRGIEIHSLMEF